MSSAEPANPEALREFIQDPRFAESGSLVLDLDGTALHEERGRIYIPDSVREGVRAVHDLGRPVIINTLRFPLSVMRTIGHEWYDITNVPIPVVSVNGAVTGVMKRSVFGVLTFETFEAIRLDDSEIDSVVEGLQGMLDAGLRDIAVFYYTKNWIEGESIWTPNPDETGELQRKYISSTWVYSSSLERLAENMKRAGTCMIFVLTNESRDRLMAYQHTAKRGHFTHEGVDKLSGLARISERLGIDLDRSVGAGDAEIDTFLCGVGVAIRVGSRIRYEGRAATVEVPSAHSLGALLSSAVGPSRAVEAPI